MPLEMPLTTPADLCAFVDSIGAPEAGQLEVVSRSGRRLGGVFIQEERVCWIAADGLASRLRQLLLERTTLDARGFVRHVARCRDAKLVLADELVALGIIDAADLREAFALHSVECLARMCGPDAVGSWTPRRSAYAPRYSFGTAELLARAGALTRSAEAAEVAPRLVAQIEDAAAGAWAAAFVVEPDVETAVPIAAVGAYPATASALLDAGRWGAQSLDVAHPRSRARPSAPPYVEHDTGTIRSVQLACGFLVVDRGARERAQPTIPYFGAPTNPGALE